MSVCKWNCRNEIKQSIHQQSITSKQSIELRVHSVSPNVQKYTLHRHDI